MKRTVLYAASVTLALTTPACILFEPIYDTPPNPDADASTGDDAADATAFEAAPGESGGEVSGETGDDAADGSFGDGASEVGADATPEAGDAADACTDAPSCAGAQRVQCGTVLETCASAALCTPTACTPPACAIGDTKCDGVSFETCKSDRTGFAVSDTCTSAALCTRSGCNVASCTPSATRCSGNLFQTCKADGTGYATTATCATAALCGSSGCAAPACMPGDTTCMGNLYEVCNPDQTGFVMSNTCVTAALCTSGGCKAPVCNVGDAQCVGQQHQKCNNPGRDGFTTDQTCTASQICSATNGCMICNPGSHQCGGSGGNVYQQCAADGMSWTTVSTCATAGLCSATSGCATPVCTAGTTQCSGKTVQTCDPSETKWNNASSACAVDCNAGACVTVTGLAVAEAWGCAVRSDHQVYCWGQNRGNQFGWGTSITYQTRPTRVPALEPAVAISGSAVNGCAISTTGQLKCWGDNSTGIAGNGTTSTTYLQPTLVSTLSNVSAVSVGDQVVCAVVGTAQDVYCWGWDNGGQAGVLPTQPAVSAPTYFGVWGATSVALTGATGCAVTGGGAVTCWGSGYLGDGTKHSTAVGPATLSLSGISAVVGSDSTSGMFAVATDGTVYAWGPNNLGQCGTGGTAPVLSPLKVLGPSAGAAFGIAGGLDNSVPKLCLSSSTGNMCWGGWTPGLGSVSYTPIADSLLGRFTTVVADWDATETGLFSCELLDGNVYCVGKYNSQGELGDGTTAPHTTLNAVAWP